MHRPDSALVGGKHRVKNKARRSIGGAQDKPLPATVQQQQHQQEELLDDAELEQALNIRVKERAPDDGGSGGGGGRSRPVRRLGQLFRDPSPSAAAIKETIKRPLTGLFRRPGSKSGSRPSSRSGKDEQQQQQQQQHDDTPTPAVGNGHVLIDDGELEQLAKARPSTARRGALKADRGGTETTTETWTMETATESGRRATATSSPDIPHLEDMRSTEFGDGIAHAPSVAVHHVATYRELDSALMKHAAFASLEDIDLSLLTRLLCPESEVKDEDVPWTWDYLYTSICTELREEWALDAVEDDEPFDSHPVAATTAVGHEQKQRLIVS